MTSVEIFQPTVPADEQQATYEQTDLTFEPLLKVDDTRPIEKRTLRELGLNFLDDEQAFLLYNVLSPSECRYYIEAAEKLGFGALTYRPDYRNNDRVVAISREVSQLIWQRIQSFVQPSMDITEDRRQRVGPGYKLEGRWLPIGLNETWR
jgi:hypothetical protein